MYLIWRKRTWQSGGGSSGSKRIGNQRLYRRQPGFEEYLGISRTQNHA